MFNVTRFFYPHGVEGESMGNTRKDFEDIEKAIKYSHRYAKGIRFAGVQIESEDGKLLYEITSGSDTFDYRTKESSSVLKVEIPTSKFKIEQQIKALESVIFTDNSKDRQIHLEALEVLKKALNEVVAKCNNCQYCKGTVYGDIEEFKCSRGYYKKFKLNVETDCKGFKLGKYKY